MPSPGFLQELKRRHVWRVAVAYAIVGWLLIQVATQVFPVFHMPDWTEQLVVLLVLLGFPVAVILAWAFEMTPEGIRRTEPADSGDARPPEQTRRVGRGLDFAIIAILVLAVAFMGWRLFVLQPTATTAAASIAMAPATTTTTDASTTALPAKTAPPDTLVVLPFTNLGNDPGQAYFSDGITEELTNALGQNTGLRVIAWDTASRYREGAQTATAIGKALNVANLLHGSIRRQGDAVRVTAELVDTTTGYQLWSNHYDDTLKNIFAVQDRISQAIADALKTKFSGTRGARTIDPRAHDLVLKARALMQTSGLAVSPYEQARRNFEQAIALEPDYAAAHAGLARAWFELSQYSTLPLEDVLAHVRTEAGKALALDPRNVDALVQIANADAAENRNAEALANYQRALEIDPSNAVAHLDYALMLPIKEGLAQTLEAVRLDPENAIAQSNLASYYTDLGDYRQALAPVQAAARLAPHSTSATFNLAEVYASLQRHDDAAKVFDLAPPTTPLASQMISAGRLAYRSVLDPSLRPRALAATDALRKRDDLAPYSLANVLQLYLVLGEKGTAMTLLSKVCAAAPVACSDLSINPSYMALRDEPAFPTLVKRYDTTHAD